MTEKNCFHCGGSIEVRNPRGTCDHLYYPDNCKICKKIRKLLKYGHLAEGRRRRIKEKDSQVKLLKEKLVDCEKSLGKCEQENARLRKLLEKFIDPDECQYDHHGYCQAHNLQENCPHKEAKLLLKEIK